MIKGSWGLVRTQDGLMRTVAATNPSIIYNLCNLSKLIISLPGKKMKYETPYATDIKCKHYSVYSDTVSEMGNLFMHHNIFTTNNLKFFQFAGIRHRGASH
ncbi:hypothetical protein KUTeg_000900 [Tegillarca granosa]|uniref:Uncharacterized protein n=1 Tax=Tegillarca granosa TaxID=220873 RepID=A0ABQ9FWC2_TEGGR|nr:hypothetical protein KUTeg_000900 [Tegillarca granosa]